MQLTFSLLLSVYTVDKLADDVNFITPFVNSSIAPTVASGVLTSITGITAID